MAERDLYYAQTETPVRLGDRILVHRWLRRSRVATVVYVPGQSKPNLEVGDDQWAYRFDDGTVYVVIYAPHQIPSAPNGIEFVCRAREEALGTLRELNLEDGPLAQPADGKLALIGCAAVAVTVIVTGVFVFTWAFGQ